MKATLTLAGAICALLLFLAVATPATVAAQAKLDGKAIFLAQKCNLCHDVSSAAITATTKSAALKGPDLTGKSSKRDATLLNNYLRKKADVDGKKHKKEFTGSDEEIGALIAWLQQQEKK
ncbi:MAG TPA: c-type cytochrome [Thermoanaerobaculia bacterium]|nr:c-type cytochrome [Thermoanaerobaculia bacterium]